MSTLSVIRAGTIGTAAVVLPGAAYGAALVFSIRGEEPFLGFLGVALAVVGALAWTCVRFADFPSPLGIVLTTLPFMAATLFTVNPLITDKPVPFVIQAVILALAVGAAWGGTRLAKRYRRSSSLRSKEI
jgi:hypothetical protein